MKLTHGIALIALTVCLAIVVQAFQPFAQPIIANPQPDQEIKIPDGTQFTVLTIDEISSKTASENDPVNFKVAEDVKINGVTIIAKDTLVKGVVANVEQRGHLGKGGKLGLRIESTTTVDGQKLRLRASKGKADTGTVGSTLALSLLISPLFLLRRGNHATIKPGTSISVYTDEDKKVIPPGTSTAH